MIPMLKLTLDSARRIQHRRPFRARLSHSRKRTARNHELQKYADLPRFPYPTDRPCDL